MSQDSFFPDIPAITPFKGFSKNPDSLQSFVSQDSTHRRWLVSGVDFCEANDFWYLILFDPQNESWCFFFRKNLFPPKQIFIGVREKAHREGMCTNIGGGKHFVDVDEGEPKGDYLQKLGRQAS